MFFSFSIFFFAKKQKNQGKIKNCGRLYSVIGKPVLFHQQIADWYGIHIYGKRQRTKIRTEKRQGNAAAYGPRNKACEKYYRIFHIYSKFRHVRSRRTAAVAVRLFEEIAAHEGGDGLITEHCRCTDTHHKHYRESSHAAASFA